MTEMNEVRGVADLHDTDLSYSELPLLLLILFEVVSGTEDSVSPLSLLPPPRSLS